MILHLAQRLSVKGVTLQSLLHPVRGFVLKKRTTDAGGAFFTMNVLFEVIVILTIRSCLFQYFVDHNTDQLWFSQKMCCAFECYNNHLWNM